jgi:hypothetical protein
MKTTIEFFGDNYEINIVKEVYNNNKTTALVAVEEDGVFGVITVNDDKVKLEEGEILVKAWGENEWVLQLPEKLPEVFQDTGKRIRLGYAEGQVWRFNEAA